MPSAFHGMQIPATLNKRFPQSLSNSIKEIDQLSFVSSSVVAALPFAQTAGPTSALRSAPLCSRERAKWSNTPLTKVLAPELNHTGSADAFYCSERH